MVLPWQDSTCFKISSLRYPLSRYLSRYHVPNYHLSIYHFSKYHLSRYQISPHPKHKKNISNNFSNLISPQRSKAPRVRQERFHQLQDKMVMALPLKSRPVIVPPFFFSKALPLQLLLPHQRGGYSIATSPQLQELSHHSTGRE